MPMAATTQIVAALVRPVTAPRVWRIVPAPMKPTPARIWAATRPGSPLSAAMRTERTVNRVAPMLMRMLVRRPAGFPFSSRSRPMAPPSKTARTSWTSSSSARVPCGYRSPTAAALACPAVAARGRAAIGEGGDEVVAVHARDEPHADGLGARGLALEVVGAGAEAFGVHLRHHAPDTGPALGLPLGEQAEMGDLCCGEEHRGGIGAGGDAGPAADAGGGIHGEVGRGLRHRDRVAVRSAARARRDEPARGDDAVERAAVHHEV